MMFDTDIYLDSIYIILKLDYKQVLIKCINLTCGQFLIENDGNKNKKIAASLAVDWLERLSMCSNLAQLKQHIS